MPMSGLPSVPSSLSQAGIYAASRQGIVTHYKYRYLTGSFIATGKDPILVQTVHKDYQQMTQQVKR